MTQCRYCKKEAVEGKTMCQKHLEARRKVSQQYRANKIEKGLCTACGVKPLETKLYCARCRIIYRKITKPKPCVICLVEGHERRDHKVFGICWYCPQKVLLGSNLCRVHHEERAERERKQAQALRQEWQRLGKCLVCGKKAVTKTRCKVHQQYAADWERNHRVRLS